MSVITIERKVLEKNDEIAQQNRALFAERRLNHLATVTGGVRAEECGKLLSEFFAERR